MKINTPKIDKIMKIEINLSFLKFMYLGQVVSDLSKLDLKIEVRVFSIETKNQTIEQKPFFCGKSRFFGTPSKCANTTQKVKNSHICATI